MPKQIWRIARWYAQKRQKSESNKSPEDITWFPTTKSWDHRSLLTQPLLSKFFAVINRYRCRYHTILQAGSIVDYLPRFSSPSIALHDLLPSSFPGWFHDFHVSCHVMPRFLNRNITPLFVFHPKKRSRIPPSKTPEKLRAELFFLQDASKSPSGGFFGRKGGCFRAVTTLLLQNAPPQVFKLSVSRPSRSWMLRGSLVSEDFFVVSIGSQNNRL